MAGGPALLPAHDLNGFDMVVAITQETINYQLARLFETGVIKPDLKFKNDVGKDQPVRIELEARLAAPVVEIRNDSDRCCALLFHLRMVDGTLWSALTSNIIPIRNWDLVFDVNLDMLGLVAAARQTHKRIPQVAEDLLSRFAPSVFTIQHIATDFEHADLATFDVRRSKCPLPPTIEAGGDLMLTTNPVLKLIRSALQTHFQSLAGSDKPYILRYPIAAAQGEERGQARVLDAVPSGCSFSTTFNPAAPELSTLNFLVLGSSQQAPVNAGRFAPPLVTAPGPDGRLCISKAAFFERWLFPAVRVALESEAGPALQGKASVEETAPAAWNLSYQACYEREIEFPPGGLHEVLENGTRRTAITLQNPSKTSAQVDIQGSHELECSPMDPAHHLNGSRYAAGREFSALLRFLGGAGGRLGLDYAALGGSGAVKRDELPASDSPQRVQRDVDDHLETAVANTLACLQNVVADLRACNVLAPRDVFFLKNPQFDAAGNLLLDVTYKL